MTTLLEKVGQPGVQIDRLANEVISNPTLLDEIFNGLDAKPARIKYGCAKVFRLLAEQQPALIAPYFNRFVALLDHENNIMKWEGLFVLSHLAKAVKQSQFAKIYDKYFSFIPGPIMISAANAIQGGARIALAYPAWADRIALEILKVSRARYQTAECQRVATGHAITALGEFFDLLKEKQPVLEFVRKQSKNSRAAVVKKAEKFLKKNSN
jgi:hypothetical protein